MNINDRVKSISSKIDGIIKTMLSITNMIPGSYNQVYCKCGKPTCWCYKENKGHLARRITWYENGKYRTKAIPQKDIQWIKSVTQNYKKYKKSLKTINMLKDKLTKYLEKHRKEIITKTRKKRNILNN